MAACDVGGLVRSFASCLSQIGAKLIEKCLFAHCLSFRFSFGHLLCLYTWCMPRYVFSLALVDCHVEFVLVFVVAMVPPRVSSIGLGGVANVVNSLEAEYVPSQKHLEKQGRALSLIHI